MNSVTIIAIIVVLLACLVCYAFVSQALEERRQRRQRLMAALQVRAGNLKYMLNSFPAGFLPRELTLLIQRGLADVCEQLIVLDPKNGTPKEDLASVTQQMRLTRDGSEQSQKAGLDAPQQINDIKQCLEELYKVVHHEEMRQSLSSSEADALRLQIRQLLLGATVDAYILQAREARQREKIRLTQHYFELAYRLLAREDVTGAFEQKKARLKVWLQELATQVETLSPAAAATVEDSEQAEIDRAWERFSEAEEGWKKKNLYD